MFYLFLFSYLTASDASRLIQNIFPVIFRVTPLLLRVTNCNMLIIRQGFTLILTIHAGSHIYRKADIMRSDTLQY